MIQEQNKPIEMVPPTATETTTIEKNIPQMNLADDMAIIQDLA